MILLKPIGIALLVLLVICLLPLIALLSMAFVPLALRSAREIDEIQN